MRLRIVVGGDAEVLHRERELGDHAVGGRVRFRILRDEPDDAGEVARRDAGDIRAVQMDRAAKRPAGVVRDEASRNAQ